MRITTSNILSNSIPTITAGESLDDPANITNQDFSANYTSLSQQILSIQFGAVGSIDYVAIAGVKIKGGGVGSTITVSDGGSIISTIPLARDHCVVASFDPQPFTNLTITLTNASANLSPTVSYIAAGLSVEVPNGGESGGYNRNWLSRKLKNKTTTNASSAPIAVLRKPVQLSGKLSIPNVTALFSQTEWMTFLDFAEQNLFFIIENPLIPESAYCCYEMTSATTKAHNATRALNNLALAFKVFTGL